MRSPYLLPFLLFGLTLFLRLPTVGLPLEGDAAVRASVAECVGDERGWVPAGMAPVLPLITGAVIAAHVNPTTALRFVDLLLGALVAPLAWLLARRMGLSAATAAGFGLLLSVHPFLAVNAGGVHPGDDALALALLLGALALLISDRPRTRRLGAVAALVLALSHAAGPLYAIPLLVLHALREPGPRWQVLMPLVGLAVLLAGPVPPLGVPGPAFAPRAALLGWLPLAGLGVLWLASPFGWRRLAAAGPGRAVLWAWSAATVLHLGAIGLGRMEGPLRFELDAASGGALLIPFLVLTSWVGAAGLARPASRAAAVWPWARAACVGAALLGSIWVANGPLQIALAPARPAAAGRLTWLRQAVELATEAVGANDWVVLGVAEGEPATQASLADACPGRPVCRRAPLPEEPSEDGLRVLLPFPASAYPATRPFSLVLPAPRRGQSGFERITTFGGAAIFEQEPVARVGAYLVVRLRGTSAADGEREDE